MNRSYLRQTEAVAQVPVTPIPPILQGATIPARQTAEAPIQEVPTALVDQALQNLKAVEVGVVVQPKDTSFS